MIRISEVTIRNFLSIGNITQKVNLSLPGLTLVLGENTNATEADERNGVGKTTIMHAISYALFGEPLSKIKYDNLVNNINNKNMLVSVSFEVNDKKCLVERGRKPGVLRFFIDGELNKAKGNNSNTQEDIDKILGMSHLMFKHLVALSTDTDPFMKLKAAEQREVIEELLGITQLSLRATALKAQMDVTKDEHKDEESRIKANNEANARIEEAITRAEADAEAWRLAHDHQINSLIVKVEAMTNIDIDAEIAIFDLMDDWLQKKSKIDFRVQNSNEEMSNCQAEITRLKKEIQRYTDEAARVDSGEVARLEAQMKRYLTESEQDISVQLNRLSAEANRRKEEANGKLISAEKLANDMKALQAQLDNPDAHTCSTCGQGISGTTHLAAIMQRLQAQIDALMAQIEKAVADAESCNDQAAHIDVEIEQTKEAHAAKKDEARGKAKSIQQDIEVAKTVLDQQKAAASARVKELTEMLHIVNDRYNSCKRLLDEAKDSFTEIGPKPLSTFINRDAVWKLKNERDALLAQIEVEIEKPNIHLTKVEGLRSTLVIVNYDVMNDLNLKMKHEVFLYKLLTAKDSFIRKKIVDQNLAFLNTRINHYLDRLNLPHEVRFMPDLTINIAMMGRDLDFEQLSRGQKNRVILSTWWAFRDVWESLNDTCDLLFVDEVLDFGMDGAGASLGINILQTMARQKNVFLISHRENLADRADRVLLIRMENEFTSITEQ